MDKRKISIDIFRGLTVALMVFVNDSWAILDPPGWMVHLGTWTDGMSLADIVYPMFLFAMGMSVPLALEKRLAKGNTLDTLRHILSRTLALLVMGVFIVNSESGMAVNKGVFWILMIVGFFLIWNTYPEGFKARKWLQAAGVVLLATLAITFRAEDGGLFRAHWWGILGQIGWMYLFTATAYLLCREKPWILAVLWAALCFVNLSVVPMRGREVWIGRNILADMAGALHLENGHSAIMSLGGAITVLAGRKLKSFKTGIGLAAAAVLAVLGMAAHSGWIISKNLGTLPWCLYVSAISVALYTLLSALEAKGWTSWAKPIMPAGTATLTVYMLPYFFYSFWVFFVTGIPSWMSGWVGVVKSLLFSALCIFLASLLGKAHIKLKI